MSELPSAATNAATQEPSHVLVADDEPALQRIFQRAVARAGLEAVIVSGGAAAVSAVAGAPNQFRCVILDVTMPDLDGVEAARAIHRIAPGLPIVLTSGWSDQTLQNDVPIAAFLPKPFRVDDVMRILQSLSARP